MNDRNAHSRGQILPLFAFVVLGMCAMLALLFDGAQAFVMRRQLQSTADSAALAAANVVQAGTMRGCATSNGSTTPRAEVLTAARDAAAANLPGLDPNTVVVTCATEWSNAAVKVSITRTSGTLFAHLLGMNSVNVTASGTALNGQINGGRYSVITLNRSHTSWHDNQGCPSLLFSGGPTATFEGSIAVDSSCPAASGGAFGTNGNSAVISLNNGSTLRAVGGYNQGPLTINPAPQTNNAAYFVRDPLAGLPLVSTTEPSLPTQSNTRLVLNNETRVLNPGIYTGGIQLKNSSIAYMKPGIYVMDGGGLDLGAQSQLYSIPSNKSSTSVATWTTDCVAGSCGVLIYNKGTTATMNNITVGAGATLELMPYAPSADPNGHISEYENLLIWQKADPVPTSTYKQPDVLLNGGGTFNIRGTLYAPSAQVYMAGNSGGSGGGTIALTLQFICFDMRLDGNVTYYFFYRGDAFAKPLGYGLVQ